MSPDVSGNYTVKSRNAIQHSRNIERPPYAFWMDFGTRLKDARNDAGLTGERLGEALGVSKQTIAHWEANRYEPRLMHLARLCEVLGVTADWLLTGRSVEPLSPSAIEQGRFYDALSRDGRRMWETAKTLIRDGERVSPERDSLHADTFIANTNKHIQYSIPGTGKNKGAQSGQRNTHPKPKPPERGEHTQGATPRSRAGKA